MGCIVDKEETNEVYSSCVLDYKKPEDCTKAAGLTKREECIFWVVDAKAICPHCKQEIK